MADTPMLNKLLEYIAENDPQRIVISPRDYVELRGEVLLSLGAMAHTQNVLPPPDGATGFAGYLYGVPLYIGAEDKLIKAAQKALNEEDQDGADGSSDR